MGVCATAGRARTAASAPIKPIFPMFMSVPFCNGPHDNTRRVPRLGIGRFCGYTFRRSLHTCRNSTVFLDPRSAEFDRFIRGQPGPVGATGAQCDPDCLPVDMLFDRERSGGSHYSASCVMNCGVQAHCRTSLFRKKTANASMNSRGIVTARATFLPHLCRQAQLENRDRCKKMARTPLERIQACVPGNRGGPFRYQNPNI